jgi:hypothetical protein
MSPPAVFCLLAEASQQHLPATVGFSYPLKFTKDSCALWMVTDHSMRQKEKGRKSEEGRGRGHSQEGWTGLWPPTENPGFTFFQVEIGKDPTPEQGHFRADS